MAAKNIVVYLSGVQGDGVVDRAVGGNVISLADLKDLTDMAAKCPDPPLVKGWFGSIARKQHVVTQVYNDVASFLNYVPGSSKLVIYGYSAGGMNALDLCRKFDDHNAQAVNKAKQVKVDLLVTVDAAAREETKNIDRHLGNCVLANDNHYQKAKWSEELGRSEGGPNGGTAHCTPNEKFYDSWSVTHGNIREKTWPEIVKRMQSFFGGP